MNALLALLLLSVSPALAAEKPNFVFIDICSARADRFGVYGHKRATTPRIDALAKKGVVFDNALAQGSWCLPNYATLFTGLRPEAHGVYANRPRPPEADATLAERLREGGYRTAAFSGGVYMIPEWGLSRGFDDFVSAFSTAAKHVPAPVSENVPGIESWVDDKKASKDGRPFFLYVAVDDLHAPYHSDEPEAFDPGYEGPAHDTHTFTVPFARAYNGEPSGYSAEVKARADAFKKDPKALAHYAAHYDAALRQADGQVGRIIDGLRKRGLDKNTVFIVTSDHGEMLGEQGLLGHTQGLYEPNLRVPLVVADPAAASRAGARVGALIERVDLMPTILDRAGVDYSDLALQGRSFLPLLKDPAAPWREAAYASQRRNLAEAPGNLIDERVVRTGRWKLHHYAHKGRFELYDLAADPLELKDVSAERPDVVSELAFKLVNEIELARPHAPGAPERRPASGTLERAVPKN